MFPICGALAMGLLLIYYYRSKQVKISSKLKYLGTNRESPGALGRGWEGVPMEPVEIEIGSGTKLMKLRKWWRGNYLKKILQEIKGHPYNRYCTTTKKEATL
jgi:hypothetical protein